MKNIFYYLFFASIATYTASAQDIIVMKNGTAVKAKVQEITSNEIKYKKFSNLNGPLFVVDKSEVFAVNFENGEVENYASYKAETDVQHPPVSKENSSQPTIIAKPADVNNATLLAKYNREVVPVKQKKVKKRTYCGTYISYGITDDSIISNEDIEVSFERVRYNTITDSSYSHFAYNIKIKNKTAETIFIDLAKSTRTETDGSYRVYYDPSEMKTATEGGGTTNALHFGLVSIARDRMGSSTTLYNPQTQVIIPPASIGYFSQHKLKAVKTGENLIRYLFDYVTVSEGENLAYKKFSTTVHEGEIFTFAEARSPHKLKYKVYYSKSDNTKESYILEFTLYVHQIFGYSYWVDIFGSIEDQDNLIIMTGYANRYTLPRCRDVVEYSK